MSPCLRQLAIGLVLSSFTSLTVQANPLAEEQLYDIACSACHSLGQTPDHHIGPPLGGLLNRPAGALPERGLNDTVELNHLVIVDRVYHC